jgi:hypothetical protein
MQSLDSISSSAEQIKRYTSKESPRPVIRAKLHTPRSIIDRTSAQNGRREKREIETGQRDSRRLWIEAIGLIVAAALALLTWKTANIAKIACAGRPNKR